MTGVQNNHPVCNACSLSWEGLDQKSKNHSAASVPTNGTKRHRHRLICGVSGSEQRSVRSLYFAALIGATYAWTATAAQERVELGLLACTLAEQSSSETDGSAAGAQALCTFKPKNGAQESYLGNIQLVKPLAMGKVTLLWRVKVPAATTGGPGFLEQKYAADPKTPASQIPDLVGEPNSSVVLQSMADRKVGSAGAKEGSSADGIAVLRVELKLKSTTG